MHNWKIGWDAMKKCYENNMVCLPYHRVHSIGIRGLREASNQTIKGYKFTGIIILLILLILYF